MNTFSEQDEQSEGRRQAKCLSAVGMGHICVRPTPNQMRLPRKSESPVEPCDRIIETLGMRGEYNVGLDGTFGGRQG